MLRPAPPTRPLNFGTLLTLGCLIEMKSEGGWWEVELLGASDGPLAYKPPVTEPRVEELDDDGAVNGAGTSTDEPGEPKYTVRLLTAPSESVGVYEVAETDLRPGWQWNAKAGRWAGRWALAGSMTVAEKSKFKMTGIEKLGGVSIGGGPAASPEPKAKKSKSKPKVEKASALSEAAQAIQLAKVKQAWPLGRKVEVKQSDPGLMGAWFEGEIIDYKGHDQCVVRYDELHEGDDSDKEEEPAEEKPKEAPAPKAEANGNGEAAAAGGEASAEEKERQARTVLPPLQRVLLLLRVLLQTAILRTAAVRRRPMSSSSLLCTNAQSRSKTSGPCRRRSRPTRLSRI